MTYSPFVEISLISTEPATLFAFCSACHSMQLAFVRSSLVRFYIMNITRRTIERKGGDAGKSYTSTNVTVEGK
jgi:hypothetical protein